VANNNISRLQSFNRASNSNIKIYPNPTNAMLNIDILEGTYDEIVVFSTSGKLLYKVENNSSNLRIDVSQYASGMYFIKFVSNGIAVTKRFIKE
jgi:hypothetical protein